MKKLNHEEQAKLIEDLDNPDYLPVHRDVVEKLATWHGYWGALGPQGRRSKRLWRELNTHPLPTIPEKEKPKHFSFSCGSLSVCTGKSEYDTHPIRVRVGGNGKAHQTPEQATRTAEALLQAVASLEIDEQGEKV